MMIRAPCQTSMSDPLSNCLALLTTFWSEAHSIGTRIFRAKFLVEVLKFAQPVIAITKNLPSAASTAMSAPDP